MSRIHDLVSRAEKDREVLRLVEVELSRADETPAARPVVTSVPENGSSPPTSSSASLHSPGTVEGWVASCPACSWAPDPATMLFLAGKEEARGAEEFRALRSRLYRMRETRQLKKLVVTSSLAGEGRSFVAANLAQVLALQPTCRVLLIDGDLRTPLLHLRLGTSPEPGLSEYLLDEADYCGIMQKGSPDRLFFIPSGHAAAGPTELLGNERLKSLLNRVESAFDWIIFDSPPALPYSDACLLANCCDAVLMVVRSSSTPLETVRKARRKFREGHLAGVVLNGTDRYDSPEIH